MWEQQQVLVGAERLSLWENSNEYNTSSGNNNNNNKNNNNNNNNNNANHPIIPPFPESSDRTLRWVKSSQNDEANEWSLVATNDDNHNNNNNNDYYYDHKNEKENNDPNRIAHVLEHIVLPHDTFSGLCLKYKTSGIKLRQYNNGFSGTSLSNAPAKLYIPITKRHRCSCHLKLQNRTSKEFLEHFVLAEVPGLTSTNLARDYLDKNNWDVDAAIQQSRRALAVAEKEQQQIKAAEEAAAAATKKKKSTSKNYQNKQRTIPKQQQQQQHFSSSPNNNNNNNKNAINAFQDLFRSFLVDDVGGTHKSKMQQNNRRTTNRRPSLRSLSSSSASSSSSSNSSSSPEEDYVVDMLTPPSSLKGGNGGQELRERGMQQRRKERKELEYLVHSGGEQNQHTQTIQNVVKNVTAKMIPTKIIAGNTIHNFKTKMSMSRKQNNNMPSASSSSSARQAFYDNGNKLSEKINNRNHTSIGGGAADKLFQMQRFITKNRKQFPW